MICVSHECFVELLLSSDESDSELSRLNMNLISPIVILSLTSSAEYFPSYSDNVQATTRNEVEYQMPNDTEISVRTLTVTITQAGTANPVDGHGFCSPDTLVP